MVIQLREVFWGKGEKHKTLYGFKATVLHHRPVSYIVTDSVHTRNRTPLEKHCQNLPVIRSVCVCERFTDYCAILKLFKVFSYLTFSFNSCTKYHKFMCRKLCSIGKSEFWWNGYSYYLTPFQWKRYCFLHDEVN